MSLQQDMHFTLPTKSVYSTDLMYMNTHRDLSSTSTTLVAKYGYWSSSPDL
jgi:hypothetical protein